jgi:hypothetical protein
MDVLDPSGGERLFNAEGFRERRGELEIARSLTGVFDDYEFGRG